MDRRTSIQPRTKPGVSRPPPARREIAVQLAWYRVASGAGVFRPINRGGRLTHDSLTDKTIWWILRKYTPELGFTNLAPHDLRRYAESRIMPSRLI